MENPAYDLRTVPLPCPQCKCMSDSIKQYSVAHLVVFVLVFVYHQTGKYTGCSSCMRGYLLARTAINIIPANLLFPFIFLFHSIQFLRTYTRGHSRAIRKLLE
jgi:hypothetical protein